MLRAPHVFLQVSGIGRGFVGVCPRRFTAVGCTCRVRLLASCCCVGRLSSAALALLYAISPPPRLRCGASRECDIESGLDGSLSASEEGRQAGKREKEFTYGFYEWKVAGGAYGVFTPLTHFTLFLFSSRLLIHLYNICYRIFQSSTFYPRN